MLSKFILIGLFFFLILCILLHTVVAIYMWNFLWENIEKQKALRFEFWYRVLIEKHFREQELYMILKQSWFLERQCEVLINAFAIFVDPDWFRDRGYY